MCVCFLAVTVSLVLDMFIKCLIDCIPLDKAWMLCHLVSGSQQSLCEQPFFPDWAISRCAQRSKFRLCGSCKSKGASPSECEECPWLSDVGMAMWFNIVLAHKYSNVDEFESKYEA